MTHQHFDLAAAEAKMRADCESIKEQTDSLVATGHADREFTAAQRLFDEARIQFTLACMKAENEGTDRNVLLSAGGYSVGNIWAGMLATCVGARERDVVNGWLHQALAQSIGAQAAAKTISSTFKPMEGSRA